ncbi:MAG: aminotransferase class V-fold PLP-dependent enzyme [Gammaproteobacteria bacterium]|nr:aminotransferase class V-fold PLP-dependent enzyme [Gammaproteobacteria bacterium]
MHPEFPLADDIVHLNHAGVGPWPRRTIDAIARFADENMRLGSRHYLRWLEVERDLREQLRWLINAASADDIALLKNTSEALSMVAYGIDWRSGDNVVASHQEFPSNRIVWESLGPRFGVEVRLADLDRGATPEDALLAHVDKNTRLLSVSSVQYASGMRMDLDRLGEACRRLNVLFCVDAIQTLGALPFDVQTCGADFVMADGHKWMLAPEGVALFYCKPECREQIHLTQFGWHMVEDHNDYDRMDWQPAVNARRFEAGSANNMGIHALNASLSLLREEGLSSIHEIISRNILCLYDSLQDAGCEVITPRAAERRAGIITFRHPHKDNRAIYEHLQSAGVLCARRAGGIRFSPHFYTPTERLDRALNTLQQAVDACG